MVATILLKLVCTSQVLLPLATPAKPDRSFIWQFGPAVTAAVLLSWSQGGIFSKSIALCTGVAAGHLLDVCLRCCFGAVGALRAKLCKQVDGAQPTTAVRDLGSHVFSKAALACIAILLCCTFLHAFLGLCVATALLAFSIASEAARAAARKRISSNASQSTQQQPVAEQSVVPSGAVRARQQVSQSSIGVNPVEGHGNDIAQDYDVPSCDDNAVCRCSCVQARGHTVVGLLLLSSALALPSAVAAAKSSWSRQAIEDVLPASSIVLWAWLLSVTCRSSTSKLSTCMPGSNEPSPLMNAYTSRHTAACQCEFSQLAFSQECLSLCSCVLCMHWSFLVVALCWRTNIRKTEQDRRYAAL